MQAQRLEQGGGDHSAWRAKRAQILTLLCKGSSMRSVSCVTDLSIDTVAKLLEDVGF